ncbi:DUF397 domain-containing protein [Streptomyces sp. PRh5]|uniref:DUF397 domain-containing protein n=1 Tax=Streptomyces sp. PRh5 TaxID=1158056 RepID=UPI0004B90BB8|nr:DUF397 domain-containing protein [Streptomyces sp. PRh5]
MCEVALPPVAADSIGTSHLRESDDPEVVISTTPAALRAFLRAAKAGVFDRPSESA